MKHLEMSFNALIEKGYGYDEQSFHSCDWDVLRILYTRNYALNGNKDARIPKKIHQIWLGGSMPERFEVLCHTWKKFNPSWEYKLWDEGNIGALSITESEVYKNAQNLGMKSDMLRYEILQREGGVYVDTDFECIRPFDDFLNLEFFTGISYDSNVCLYMGLIGTIPYHPIINACVYNLKSMYTGHVARTIMGITGPYYFTRQFLSNVSNYTKHVVAFPMDFFYPWPNNIKDTPFPHEFIKICTYAIHHWAISWVKTKSNGSKL